MLNHNEFITENQITHWADFLLARFWAVLLVACFVIYMLTGTR